MPLPNMLPTRPTTTLLTFEIFDRMLPSSPSTPAAALPPPDLDRPPTLPAPSSSSKPLQRVCVCDEYQLLSFHPFHQNGRAVRNILTQPPRPERLKHKWPPPSACAPPPSDMPWNSTCPPSRPAAQSPSRFSAESQRARNEKELTLEEWVHWALVGGGRRVFK